MKQVEDTSTSTRMEIWLENARIGKPTTGDSVNRALYPRDCREMGTTYKASLHVDVCFQSSEGRLRRLPHKLGDIPIMVKSSHCHLRNMTRQQLVKSREEEHELGGYFIVNGNERIIRMLIATRRHYVMALKRQAYQNRGKDYTDMATSIRCVRSDQSSATVRLHYLNNGNCNLSFSVRRQEFFVPVGVFLKCFVDASDKELFDRMIAGVAEVDKSFVSERAEKVLRMAQGLGIHTKAQGLKYLGGHFRPVLQVSSDVSDLNSGKKLLEKFIFVHLEDPTDKLNLLLFMFNKLMALVSGACGVDNPDALTHQEVALPGHLCTVFFKDRIMEWLLKLRLTFERDLRLSQKAVDLGDAIYMKKCLSRMLDVGKLFEYFLATGNFVSKSGIELSQTSGFTVVAEKLNYFRYISHFRSIHRGAYFAELRTTAVRKLLPESWGFLCPVHTPDGSPCGLLLHLTSPCEVITDCVESPEKFLKELREHLLRAGMLPASSQLPMPFPEYLPVLVDGCIVGYARQSLAPALVAKLRELKVGQSNGSVIPDDMETAYIPLMRGAAYPGLFIFSEPARFTRPVMQRTSGKQELIGSLEQCYMNIYCPDGTGKFNESKATHIESGPLQMLSVVAGLTPWSDYNQSPRNMYQCQMSKQTMGTPLHTYDQRPDTKLYRLQTPQTPIARTRRYDAYCMDEYPSGTNAVVAVLAYTGYDMEDAMIINKSAMERGFAHGTLYKTEVVDMKDGNEELYSDPSSVASHPGLDVDGLPRVGHTLNPGDLYLSKRSKVSRRTYSTKLKGEDGASVDQVTLIGLGKDRKTPRATVKLRFNRNPIIGDKFSSRHGQKGTLSQLWPDVDMPYSSATGMRPDLLINPHAFPSRMTIGMLLESMASKSGAMNGRFVDATPFGAAEEEADRLHGRSKPREGRSVVDEFGEQLLQCGYAYYGTESMISGVTGEEFQCDIFVGLVYYQRLRHMVSDKFQVRSTGPVNPLTRQPIKGRKLGGGIRFGEMERDSLLAHGASFLLHDRLHASSDYHVASVCGRCGSILSTWSTSMAIPSGLGGPGASAPAQETCLVCGTAKHVVHTALPYVFRYLACELAAMNIRVRVNMQP